MREALMQTMKRLGIGIPNQRILCAVSGGMDSVALLHCLCTLRREMGFSLYAAHFHHGIRASADGDQELVDTLCQDWEIPLTCGRGDVEQERCGRTIEETARDLRYDFLERTRATLDCQWIVTAHHAGDQAETVLMHLLRGSGVRGLRGMEPVRGYIARPLLHVEREEILRYVETHHLPYREDETNADLTYTRNRIRKELIPILQTGYNPAIIKTLCKTARAAGEDEAFLMEQAKNAFLKVRRYSLPGVCHVLSGMPDQPSLEKRILRLCLEDLGAWNVTERALILGMEAIDQGKRTDIGQGIFVDQKGEVQIYRPFTTQETAGLASGYGRLNGLSLEVWTPDSCRDALLRTRRPGDVLPGGKRLSHLLKEQGVPRCIRDALGVIVRGNRVLAVQHVWYSMELDGCFPKFTGGVIKD